MMKRVLAASAALAISATLAHAQEVKVGVNLPYTGIGAEFAQHGSRPAQQVTEQQPPPRGVTCHGHASRRHHARTVMPPSTTSRWPLT